MRRKVRDINTNTVKTFACPYIDDKTIKPLLAPVEVSKRTLDCNSASGLVNIKINDTISGGNANKEGGKCVIEVTRDISLEKIIDVSSIHGKVIGDGWFGKSGCNNFSNDEKYFVYVAGQWKYLYYFHIFTHIHIFEFAPHAMIYNNNIITITLLITLLY